SFLVRMRAPFSAALSLHDALPISAGGTRAHAHHNAPAGVALHAPRGAAQERSGDRGVLHGAAGVSRCTGLARSVVRDLRVRRLRSEEHTSELQSRENLVCRLLLA